jgi:hypothetical protein
MELKTPMTSWRKGSMASRNESATVLVGMSGVNTSLRNFDAALGTTLVRDDDSRFVALWWLPAHATTSVP